MKGFQLIEELVKKIYDGKPSLEQMADGRNKIEVVLDKLIYDSYSDDFSSRYVRLVDEVEGTDAFYDEKEKRQLSDDEVKKLHFFYEAKFRYIKEKVLS